MDPYMGRIAFNIAILMLVLISVPLLFLERDSAEFVISVLALTFTLIFLLLVVWDVRRQAKKEMLGEKG
ncbi:hypothetical protein DRO55_02965 [Candidatus Bathyarchaeota archaeon]|nr:MAG: hypothetical protein DRO55_02965 [Candidatus Bathyarchaeota archaeon]